MSSLLLQCLSTFGMKWRSDMYNVLRIPRLASGKTGFAMYVGHEKPPIGWPMVIDGIPSQVVKVSPSRNKKAGGFVAGLISI